MVHQQISDWNSAYANGPHIVGSESWPPRWESQAAAFRNGLTAASPARIEIGIPYGEHPRQVVDLFLPEAPPKGLVVFVHGGYWLAFHSQVWSHLAKGPLQQGFAVALPTYRLAPDVRISDITRDVGRAIETVAARIPGPIHLTGHSAGGHLVTRMITTTSPLPTDVIGRIRHVVSLSGVHDLRPLLRTDMNARLKLDAAEAAAESPALLEPVAGARLTCWVGGAERAEFRRQNDLLANIWTGLGAACQTVEIRDDHHFSVIDGLTDPQSALTRTLIDG